MGDLQLGNDIVPVWGIETTQKKDIRLDVLIIFELYDRLSTCRPCRRAFRHLRELRVSHL